MVFAELKLRKKGKVSRVVFGQRLLMAWIAPPPKGGEHFYPSHLRRSRPVGRRIVEERVPAAYQGSYGSYLYLSIYLSIYLNT